jgi:nucleoside-diphosphate-sugar epimerase
VVAVTAAGSAAGRAVVQAFAARIGQPGGPAEVLAVDQVPDPLGSPDGVHWRLADCAGPGAAAALSGADVVVHLATPTDLAADLRLTATARRARAVRAVQEVATGAAAGGARRLLVVTSAMVYGARADNPAPLPPDAPLQATRDSGVVGDLLDVERVLARTPRVHPQLRVTVLRPAALVGPGVDTLVTRHFESPRLLTLRGDAMLWQFCHVADLASAVVCAVEADLDGVLTVGCRPWLTSEQVEQLVGMRRVELPAALAYGTAERLHRARVLPAPPADLSYVVHPWVVDPHRLLAAGWTPRFDGEACLAALVDGIQGRRAVAGVRVERRDAALGAAGAAVALVGTAALLRQARARRNGRPRHTL